MSFPNLKCCSFKHFTAAPGCTAVKASRKSMCSVRVHVTLGHHAPGRADDPISAG